MSKSSFGSLFSSHNTGAQASVREIKNLLLILSTLPNRIWKGEFTDPLETPEEEAYLVLKFFPNPHNEAVS